jgi:hypothetical protein
MRKILVHILTLKEALRTLAFIIIHQILTVARIASIFGAIWNVLAHLHPVTRHLLLESTVAITFEVVCVIAGCVLLVYALSVVIARVIKRRAIIVVVALSWIVDRAIGLATDDDANQ